MESIIKGITINHRIMGALRANGIVYGIVDVNTGRFMSTSDDEEMIDIPSLWTKEDAYIMFDYYDDGVIAPMIVKFIGDDD